MTLFSLALWPSNFTYLPFITYAHFSASFTSPVQFHLQLSVFSASVISISIEVFRPFLHLFAPADYLLCPFVVFLPPSPVFLTDARSFLSLALPQAFSFLFSVTFLLLLFYTQSHPSRSMTLPQIHLPRPTLRSLSWVCRQLLTGKVTLCVISAFHGSPLSLQRVIISFRVKGSICYKRTRASGTEGERVGEKKEAGRK